MSAARATVRCFTPEPHRRRCPPARPDGGGKSHSAMLYSRATPAGAAHRPGLMWAARATVRCFMPEPHRRRCPTMISYALYYLTDFDFFLSRECFLFVLSDLYHISLSLLSGFLFFPIRITQHYTCFF